PASLVSCCECRSNKRRQRPREGLSHDRCAMVVDGPLANAEIGSDVLTWMSGENVIEDLPLAGRQACKACRCHGARLQQRRCGLAELRETRLTNPCHIDQEYGKFGTYRVDVLMGKTSGDGF